MDSPSKRQRVGILGESAPRGAYVDHTSVPSPPPQFSFLSIAADKGTPPPPPSRYVDTTRPREPDREIGRGAFGTVTLMSDGAVEKKSDTNTLKRLNAFEREVFVLELLSPHPNIVQFIESYTSVNEHGEAYGHLILEHALGTTVGKWLKDHKDDPSLDLRSLWYPFVQTLLLAMEYIHGKGVHHLDLHPSNVMIKITPDVKSLKVIDFGLSCSRDPESGFPGNSACGQPGHAAYYTAFVTDEKMMNYELLEAEDMRMMDLYSVGALAHLWWFGHPPYAETFKAESPEGAGRAWLMFTARNKAQFPPTLVRDDPDHPRAVQAMRELLCNPRAEDASEPCLRGKSVELPAELNALAPREALWPPR
jgi:serine/threonine protein kinase